MQAAESLGLDLADPLAGKAQGFADFFQCVRFPIIEPEPHAQDGRLTGIHFVEQLKGMLEDIGLKHDIFRISQPLILDHLTEGPARFRLIRLGSRVIDTNGFPHDR